MLGGGTFTLQNKTLPGSYINVVSRAAVSTAALERGYTGVALPLNWGLDNKIITVSAEDFIKNTRKIFGYDYADDEMKGLRDLFKNASVAYIYKLTSGGAKAVCGMAEAICSGIRGNDLKIVVTADVDEEGAYEVKTYLDTTLVDTQTVTKAADLVKNDFVTFKADATLEETAGMPLSGGTNGTVDGASHQAFLDKIEKYTSTNAIGAVTSEKTVKALYAAFAKRMRDEVGIKLQVVLYDYAADYEGVVDVKNNAIGDAEESMVYWTTGVIAGCAINASNTNKPYDGEFEVNTEYTQAELTMDMKAGKFIFHENDGQVCVLSDINSLVTLTEGKTECLQSNQTIRVVDQIAMDIARIFNSFFIGLIGNDSDGRIGLWNRIVKHHKELEKKRAIENFSDSDVTVEQGNTKKAVVVEDKVTVVNAMEQMYMTVNVI